MTDGPHAPRPAVVPYTADACLCVCHRDEIPTALGVRRRDPIGAVTACGLCRHLHAVALIDPPASA